MIALTFSFLLFSLSSDAWGLFHSYHQPSASGYMNLPKTEKRSHPTCWTVAFWTKGYSVSQQASLKDNQGLVTVWFGLLVMFFSNVSPNPTNKKHQKPKQMDQNGIWYRNDLCRQIHLAVSWFRVRQETPYADTVSSMRRQRHKRLNDQRLISPLLFSERRS